MRASPEREASQHRSPFRPDACLDDQDLRLEGFECMIATEPVPTCIPRSPRLHSAGFLFPGHGSALTLNKPAKGARQN